MKAGYSKKSISKQAADLVELRRKWAKALDRNRNQRQLLTLLLHYATILRQDAAVARRYSVQTRLAWQAETARRVSRSFAVLAQSDQALEQWRLPPVIFREIF